MSVLDDILVSTRADVERRRNIRIGKTSGADNIPAFEHRAEQLRLDVDPIDINVLGMRRLQQD